MKPQDDRSEVIDKYMLKSKAANVTGEVRILYIIDIITGNLGGTERQLIELINGLASTKFRKHLICFDDSSWFSEYKHTFRCETSIVSINKFQQISTYLNMLKLIRFIKEYKPDVVHTFFPVGNIIGVLAARSAGIRNIISSRRDYGEWMDSRYLFATRIANSFIKKIIVNSHPVRMLTEQRENVSNGKVGVIYNGIDIKFFADIQRDHELKKQLNIPEDDMIVGIVANFRPMKHHETFVKAAHEVLKIRSNVSFILVGGRASAEPIIERVKQLGESLHIAHKLHFVGIQPNVRSYLSIMDIGINCSEKEGLSNAIMEYMAVGIPCIVTRAGGNTDLIAHEFNGYTFELDDYNTLSKLILKLLDDEGTRRVFTERSREKINSEMSMEVMISHYENLYMEIAKEC